jgi:hypothetical protein
MCWHRALAWDMILSARPRMVGAKVPAGGWAAMAYLGFLKGSHAQRPPLQKALVRHRDPVLAAPVARSRRKAISHPREPEGPIEARVPSRGWREAFAMTNEDRLARIRC